MLPWVTLVFLDICSGSSRYIPQDTYTGPVHINSKFPLGGIKSAEKKSDRDLAYDRECVFRLRIPCHKFQAKHSTGSN